MIREGVLMIPTPSPQKITTVVSKSATVCTDPSFFNRLEKYCFFWKTLLVIIPAHKGNTTACTHNNAKTTVHCQNRAFMVNFSPAKMVKFRAAFPIRADGNREILGAKIADGEDGLLWEGYFDELKARGLHGVKTVISELKGHLDSFIEKTALQGTDFWEGERYYLMMVTEKIDIFNLFAPICDRFMVPIVNGKGWPTLGIRDAIAKQAK